MRRYSFYLIFMLVGYHSFSQIPLPDIGRWTSSGIRYKIYTDLKTCVAPKTGDVIWMHLEKADPEGHQVFSTREDPFFEGGVEMAVKEPIFNGDVMEMFTLMCPGDSAVAYIPVDSVDRDIIIFKNGKDKWYKYNLKLLRSLSQSAHAEEKQYAINGSRYNDSISINEWLAFNNLPQDLRDTNGIVRVFTEKQENNRRLMPGDQVEVHYRLSLIDGTSLDDSYARGEPFSLILGKGDVIKGWDMGLQHFGLKEKGMLLIPSYLAYGSQGAGGVIPPNAVLIFQIEIVSVK